MQRLLQNLKLSLTASARRWAGAVFFLMAVAVCALGWYALSTGQVITWVMFAVLLVLLLTAFFLRNRLASQLLKVAGTRAVDSRARVLRSALYTGLQQGEHLVETQGQAVGKEFEKMAVQAAKELDLAADGLKRDLVGSPPHSASPLSSAGETVCPTCGQLLRSTSRFCDHCGKPLAKCCPNCGCPARSAAARFCGECGVSLVG